ncbi:hypothetical protein JYT22_00805 [Endomicrobium sp. AH-315-J14]|nr:hypothetical protein [Endomicrobium sp. AH-315-J14]
MLRAIHVFPLIAMLTTLAGCSDGDGAECRFGADCASGVCSAAGQCLESGSDGGAGGGATGGADVATGGGNDGGAGGGSAGGDPGSGGAGACLPNDDGLIEQSEVIIMAGLSAKQLATQDVVFDTAGSDLGNGEREWDFSQALAGDHMAVVETQELGWYAGVFPGASYASRLGEASDLLGVYEVTPGALLLRGVVSPGDGLSRTELKYDPPVVVLSFPLSEGKMWATSSTVSGLAQGITVFYSEEFDYSVDKRGNAITPYAEFNVLRVHSRFKRTFGLLETTIQSHVFVTECFGTVANIRSKDNEMSKEFTDVAELRRLSP